MTKQIELRDLEGQRSTLIAYMRSKIDGDEDWHAVSDAANDLREIDVLIKFIKEQ